MYESTNTSTIFRSRSHTPKQDYSKALVDSVKNNHVEIVRMLLDAGAKQSDTLEVCENTLEWNNLHLV